MKRIYSGVMACLVSVLGFTGAVESPAGEPTPARAAHTGPVQATGVIAGTVTETMTAEHYTYMKVDTGTSEVWTVGPRTNIAVGDTVVLSSASLMADFRSSLLERTFERIYMVTSVEKQGGVEIPRNAPSTTPPQPAHAPLPADAGSFGDATGIERVDGGLTIEEIVRDKDRLVNQPVLVRGQVAKFSGEILGKNWVRLQDATTSPEGREDLVVTTIDTAEIGDIVLVRGTVATNQDLGYGYLYDVMIEKARLVVESHGASEGISGP